MFTPRLSAPAVAASLTVTVLLLSSCGGEADAESGSATSESGTVDLTWGFSLPDSAPVLLGIENGIFEEHGISVTAREAGSADLVGGLLSGDLDLSVNTGPGLALAASQNVPTVAVASITTFEKGTEGGSGSGLLVASGSEIHDPADLAGKKVGVNLLASASDFGVRQMIADDGADESSTEIVEVPFAAMGDAIARGEVDAALIAEPFLTELLDSGEVEMPMGDPIERTFGASPRLVITATQDWAAEHADVVDSLHEAVAESIAYAEENPDELHAIYEEHFGMTPELASSTHLNKLSAEVAPGSFDRINEVLVRFGAYSEPLTVEDLVAP